MIQAINYNIIYILYIILSFKRHILQEVLIIYLIIYLLNNSKSKNDHNC